MKKDFVETLRINTVSVIPPFDMEYKDKWSYISVGHINNRYGILNENGTEFLPFEYDNITICGFGLLQLSLNGKLGLLHIKQKTKGDDFYIVKLINCEYDAIDGKLESIVLLRNYTMRTDYSIARSVRAYLTKPEILTEKYVSATILSMERGLIALEGGNKSIIVSTETGKILDEMDKGFTIGGYETSDATVLQQDGNRNGRLLYIGEDEIKEYIFDGMNAYAVTGLNADGIPLSVGFIVETSKGFEILDEDLSVLSDEAFSFITVQTVITGFNKNKEIIEIPMRSQRLRIGDLEIW